MSYPCPFLGTSNETKHCKRPAESIRGWRTHMTRQHGGYDESQLAAIVGNVLPNAEAGREAFLSEAEDSGVHEEVPITEAQTAPAQPDVSAIKKEQMARRMSAKMNKFKEKLAARITQGINLIAKDKNPEWQIDEDDEKLFSEALENCFEILDVDFQIRPIQKTLENPLWVLALPLAALAMIFLPKILKQAMQKKEEAVAE